jgi:hypothetical protein
MWRVLSYYRAITILASVFFLYAVVEDDSRSAPSKPMFFSRRHRVMPTSGHGPTIGTLPVLQRTATAYHHDWFETTGFDPDGMVMESSPPLLGESVYDGGNAWRSIACSSGKSRSSASRTSVTPHAVGWGSCA